METKNSSKFPHSFLLNGQCHLVANVTRESTVTNSKLKMTRSTMRHSKKKKMYFNSYDHINEESNKSRKSRAPSIKVHAKQYSHN